MANNGTLNPRIVFFDRIGELLEILAAAAFGFSIVPFGEGWLSRVLVGLLIALLSFLLAILVKLRSDTLEVRASNQNPAMQVVNDQRLKTLETVQVGADVIDVLKLRLNEPPLATEEFVAWLEKALGRERAQEKLDVVLRYTRLDTAQPGSKSDEKRSVTDTRETGPGILGPARPTGPSAV